MIGPRFTLSYAELIQHVERAAQHLLARDTRVLGLLCDNSPMWAVLDLATQLAEITCVPIPPFFSKRQIQHVIEDAAIDTIVTDNPSQLPPSVLLKTHPVNDIERALTTLGDLVWLRLAPSTMTPFDPLIAKITYTSGTTGDPKGVCLSQQSMDKVAASLSTAACFNPQSQHLAVLPLATLLENIGGLYAPLMAGAAARLLPVKQSAAPASTNWDTQLLYSAIKDSGVQSIILVPQLLQDLVEYLELYGLQLPDLQFVAVGGAPVSLSLLRRAAQINLPVYEGYGLSECSSVVAVNTPRQHRPGSVGRPLPHVAIDFAEDGEILVHGAAFEGYLHQSKPSTRDVVATGDCGYMDADGYLYLTARKKSMFITAYGRNIAPEWVERELVLQPAIHQAAIFGEGRPWNTALIVAAADATEAMVEAAIETVNQSLPDYARISKWLYAEQPFTVKNHLLTASGRLRRDAILAHYANVIDKLYKTPQRKSV